MSSTKKIVPTLEGRENTNTSILIIFSFYENILMNVFNFKKYIFLKVNNTFSH